MKRQFRHERGAPAEDAGEPAVQEPVKHRSDGDFDIAARFFRDADITLRPEINCRTPDLKEFAVPPTDRPA
jgi:hypothetical protein